MVSHFSRYSSAFEFIPPNNCDEHMIPYYFPLARNRRQPRLLSTFGIHTLAAFNA